MSPSVTGPAKNATKSGITTSKDGERHIPSSVRPDGSLRKEIRVRPGYKPPEDVETYKNRTAEAWKNRGSGGVPGAATIEKETTTAAANKNAKRREARKKAAANGDLATPVSPGPELLKTQDPPASEPSDPEADKAKEARKLAKKLRQAHELQDKKEKGDTLLPEQFEKVIKITELLRQLDRLGFDSEGEKKTAPEGV